MGIFINLVGRFRCVRCRAESEGSIASKLLRTEYDNSCREYRVGDSEVIDGIDDFVPRVERSGSRLVVAVGDWSCSKCGLSGIWTQPYDWKAGLQRWKELEIAERCELVAAGYRAWAREVAGVELSVSSQEDS